VSGGLLWTHCCLCQLLSFIEHSSVRFDVQEMGLLSRDRESSEQFMCFNRRYHEIQAELALSGIVPSMMSDVNQEEAI